MTTATCHPMIDLAASTLENAATVQLINETIGALTATLTPCRSSGKPHSMGIRIDTDAEVRRLNAQFRQKDKATNVLSFPTDDDDAWDEDDNIMYLGDIIIAEGVLAQEAKDGDKPLAHHLQHLIIHGLLHIYGYDHIIDSEAEIMENTEITILNKLGISNPYEHA